MTRDKGLAAGDWLRHQRELRGLEVREVAIALGVATQTVYGWETGKHRWSDERAEQLAKILKLDILEVRAGLGLWVPPTYEPPGPMDRAEEMLDALEADIAEIRERLEGMDEDRRQAVKEVARALAPDPESSTG
ncbi:hypothetical protein amrb99_97810 [Actinomadura sp. RB99]|uniref:helix-turn-helix domain-containing protein n=1 Tax=Actinomadura sp. RB99 TaxID=2691577 RepID=UPI0016893E6C|nr:helix-turn-helix transcriptional regulator [Actinomadura sp. RB99]MBD2900772.1 hypothetical protein [Actinomadura sp. RB99]